MMPGGEIYERTSGKSVKVTDPLVLARLMDAGKLARDGAEVRTRRAIREIEPWMQNKSVDVRVALSAAPSSRLSSSKPARPDDAERDLVARDEPSAAA